MDNNYISNFICSIFGRDCQDCILNIEGETEITLEKLINELPTEQKDVLDFRFRGITIEEVAEKCGISEEEVKQREALGLRYLRHPNRSKQLRDYIYGYSSCFEGKSQKENRISGYCLDITNWASVAITGNKEDSIAVKDKLLEDIKKYAKGYVDLYESNGNQKTLEMLKIVAQIANERDAILKANNYEHIRNYNCIHLSPIEKLHHIIVIIENYSGKTESEEIQSMMENILLNGNRLGIHVVYVTDTKEHQIPYNSGETVTLNVVSQEEINMSDDWNEIMVLKI